VTQQVVSVAALRAAELAFDCARSTWHRGTWTPRWATLPLPAEEQSNGDEHGASHAAHVRCGWTSHRVSLGGPDGV